MKVPANRIARVALGTLLGVGIAAVIWAVSGQMRQTTPSKPLTAEIAIVQSESAAQADFGPEQTTHDLRRLVNWIMSTSDHVGAPFFIVDKPQARLLVFDGQGKLQGATSVLLGLALGDASVPGIGSRKLADIRPEERTTPAGRFVAERGHNLRGEGVVWVDYDAAVSMHRVLTTNPDERRLERLASANAADKRISSGCINVPAEFFDAQVYPPVVSGAKVIIYVLPDELPLLAVFPGLDRQPIAVAKQGG